MSDEIKLDSSDDAFDKQQKREASNQLSDDQLKRLALQHSKSQGSFQRPSEVIELPSKGLLYEESNPLSSGTIEIYHPTARDEDILMTSSKIKRGTVIDDFLKALIASPIKYDDLLVCDRDKLIIVARILAYGAKFEAEINDPDISNESQVVEIDLNAIEELEIDESLFKHGENSFNYTLPLSGVEVVFKLPTVGMNKMIDDEIKRTKQLNNSVDRSLSTRLKYLITSVNGETSRKNISDFVDNILSTRDSKDLRKYISSITPGIDLKYNFVSDLTGNTKRLEVPIGNPNFFWPNS